MHPILFQFGPITLYTYGLMLAVAFIVGIALAKKEAVRVGIDPNQILDLSFYILLSAVVGSRLLFVLTDLRRFIADPIEIFRIWNGGLVFYGGFIGAALTVAFYLRHSGLAFWKTADVLAPSVVLGQAIGRIGCFNAGCCYGKVCELPWAVTFSDPNSLARLNVPLHPTQLYEAFGNLMIFLILWFRRRSVAYEGQTFVHYLVFYGAMRFVVEIYRGDFRGDTYFGVFSVSQLIGMGMIVTGILLNAMRRRQGK